MRTPLWIPSAERKEKANLTHFIEKVNLHHQKNFKTYADLYQWSVEAIPDFWAELWDFAGIKYTRRFDSVVADLSVFPGAKWFPGARLNFAENLLRYRDDRTALIFRGEIQKSARMTYAELYAAVARLAKSLRATGVGVGEGPGVGEPPEAPPMPIIRAWPSRKVQFSSSRLVVRMYSTDTPYNSEICVQVSPALTI